MKRLALLVGLEIGLSIGFVAWNLQTGQWLWAAFWQVLVIAFAVLLGKIIRMLLVRRWVERQQREFERRLMDDYTRRRYYTRRFE